MTTLISREPRIRVPHHPAHMIDFERLKQEQLVFVRRRRRERWLRRMAVASAMILVAVIVWRASQ